MLKTVSCAPRSWGEIVEAILGARGVWLLGFRNSHILGGYACAQLVLVRDDLHLLPRGGAPAGKRAGMLRLLLR